MKKGNYIFIIVVIILLVILGIYSFAMHVSPPAAPTPPATAPAPVISTASYSCTDGKTIVASYTATNVTVALSDGRTLTLPSTVSADGTRYFDPATNVEFWSKGDGAFLQENNVTTYNNCVEGTTGTGSNGMNTFTDSANTFTFSYPTTATVSGGDGSYTQQWSYNASTLGLILAQVTIPGSTQPHTNFGEATFTVGTSSDPSAVKNCLTEQGSIKSTVTINGTPYTKLVFSDAGAGNFYTITSYRTVKNSQCYALDEVIHSTDIGNYDPSQGMTAFNQTSVQSALDAIAQSFQFMQASPQ